MAKKCWIERVKRKPKFKVRAYYRCQRCGRSRGTLRAFTLCRICFRELALRGENPRVRNACQAGHRRVDMPVSKLKLEIARILRDNHYIQDFKALDDGRHGLLRLYLKYHNDAPVIRELVRVSAPGLRRYVKAREIPRVKNGLGMAILSTQQD